MKKRYLILLFTAIFLMSGCGAKKILSPVLLSSQKGISMATVAEHNSSDDCWLVINNNIYNVSGFIGAHPGGEKNIIDYCGKDATSAFETRPTGSKTPHSEKARNMLNSYYIGDLAK